MEPRVYFTIIILFVAENESFAQYNRHLAGEYTLNDTLAVEIIADSSNNAGIYISHNDTIYAYATIDSTNNTLTSYQPLQHKTTNTPFQEKGYGSFTDNYDVIYAHFRVEHPPEQSVVYGPKEDIYTRTTTGATINSNIQATLWPNPVKTDLHFIVSEREPDANVKVLNLKGECVYTNTLSELVNNEKYVVNTQSFPPGMYVLQISGDNYISSSKFIKQ